MFNSTKILRLSKRKSRCDEKDIEEDISKRTRSLVTCDHNPDEKICFFCDEIIPDEEIHQVQTIATDNRVRQIAQEIGDVKILGKLSEGDMIALEAKYHAKCLVFYYNQVRVYENSAEKEKYQLVNAQVFAELVAYINDCCSDNEDSPVFILSDLVSLYQARLEHFNLEVD